MVKPLWTPPPERVAHSNIERFTRQIERERSLHFPDYAALHHWSVEHPEEFWPAVWEFAEVRSFRRWDRVLSNPGSMLDAQWFEGATLNFAANLLRYSDDTPAIVSITEDGTRRVKRYRDLHIEVARLAAVLSEHGVTRNSRVAGFLPNIPEAVIGMLATTSLGAIWSSCSPDFGVDGVVERFSQIEPTVLFAVDGYRYNGKEIDCREKILSIVSQLPTLRAVIFVGFLAPELSGRELPPLETNVQTQTFAEALASRSETSPRFEELPFAHPAYILYSSGTTGKPKCIVHGAGGTLLQHLKELILHTDLKRSDHIFYYTTCGWMMWNWVVTSLAVGATLVIYDGSPVFPSPSRLFDLADEEGLTVFGTSAKYIATVKKAGVSPRRTHKLRTLKTILSTGSPLLPDLFDYVYQEIKSDLCLSSISGGTDIVSCFALGNPAVPVYRGAIQVRGLGMDLQIFSEDGRSLVGEPGELVCTRPFPSQPVGFWNDPNGERYRESYFATYPNVWRHGDWAEITAHGGVVIYGRSDAVLNPGGVRIGTAELYRVVEELPDVTECVAVGQQWEGDERIVLFLKLKEGVVLDEPFRQRIRQAIRDSLTPRHVPAKIIAVPDIPRTINGKLSELAVKKTMEGKPIRNREALANPEALEYFRELSELKKA